MSRLTVVAAAVAATALAFLFGGPILNFAPHDPILMYAEVWTMAGIAALVCGLSWAGAGRSRRRWGGIVSKLMAWLAGVYALAQVYVLIAAGPMPGLAVCEANLRNIESISCISFQGTGRVPRNISDLVAKQAAETLPTGMLSPDMVICPYDQKRQHHEQGGSSYVLAPLDKVFFDKKFLEDNPGVILCAYCTVVHSRWRPERTYVTADGHVGITSGDDLQAWVSVQAEAVTWLADEFTLDELERFAQSAERHRRELASAILRYRLRQQGR